MVDRVEDGPKPALVRALGATYHARPGRSSAGSSTSPWRQPGSVSLSPGRRISVDLGALNRGWVLDNDALIGSVNVNRRNYEAAAQALASADPEWLA